MDAGAVLSAARFTCVVISAAQGAGPGRVPERRRLPQVLALSQVEAILRAQRRVRDRFLFALLFRPGCGSGRRLGCGTGMS
jgi:integrase